MIDHQPPGQFTASNHYQVTAIASALIQEGSLTAMCHCQSMCWTFSTAVHITTTRTVLANTLFPSSFRTQTHSLSLSHYASSFFFKTSQTK